MHSFVLLCLGVAFLIPFHFKPWMAFQNEAPVFVGMVCAAAWLLWSVLCKPKDLKRNAFTSLAFLLIGAMALQLMVMPDVRLGDIAIGIAYVSGFWVAWQYGLQSNEQGIRSFKTLALVWVSVGLISAAISWVQFFEMTETWNPWIMQPADSNRATGNLGQPNNFATFMLMGIVACVWLYEALLISGAFAGFVVAVLTLGALTAQSRTAWISAVGLTVGIWMMNRKAPLGRVSLAQAGSWCTVFLVTSISLKFWGFWESSIAAVEGEAQAGRYVIWKQLMVGLTQSPWVGWGWQQTEMAQQLGALQVPGLEQTSYSHNLVLDLCIWLGIPLGLLITACAVFWVATRWRAAKQRSSLMLFAFVLPLGVHSMLEMPFSYAYFLFPAAIVLGMIDRETATTTSAEFTNQTARCLSITAVALLGLFTTLVAWIGIEFTSVEEDFRMARLESQRIGAVPDEYLRPHVVLLTQWADVLDIMREPYTRDMSPAQLEKLARASRRFSWLALHFRYTVALALNGQPSAAIQELHLIKGLFGRDAYQVVCHDLDSLANSKYPELKKITLE